MLLRIETVQITFRCSGEDAQGIVLCRVKRQDSDKSRRISSFLCVYCIACTGIRHYNTNREGFVRIDKGFVTLRSKHSYIITPGPGGVLA